jgi:hypothetical protein
MWRLVLGGVIVVGLVVVASVFSGLSAAQTTVGSAGVVITGSSTPCASPAARSVDPGFAVFLPPSKAGDPGFVVRLPPSTAGDPGFSLSTCSPSPPAAGKRP